MLVLSIQRGSHFIARESELHQSQFSSGDGARSATTRRQAAERANLFDNGLPRRRAARVSLPTRRKTQYDDPLMLSVCGGQMPSFEHAREVDRRRIIAAGMATAAMATATTSVSAEKKIHEPRQLSLNEIIARHTEARGGAAALDSIRSMSVEVQIVEGGSVVTAHYACNKTPAFRIDVFDRGKHVFCEGLDAEGPWVWPSAEPRARQGVPDAKRTDIEGIEFNLYGLHAFHLLGNQLAFAGRQVIAGVDYNIVQVDMHGSYRTFLYIDPETWMIARRRDFRAAHPDIKDVKKYLEKQYSDFRPVSNVQTAFLEHQVDLTSGNITQVSIVDKMAYNLNIGGDIFRRSYRHW